MRRHHELSGNGIHQNPQTLCSESNSTIDVLTIISTACHVLPYIVVASGGLLHTVHALPGDDSSVLAAICQMDNGYIAVMHAEAVTQCLKQQ